VKISFDTTPEIDALLDELVEATGSGKKALITASLLFFAWSVRQRLMGREIAAIEPDSSRPLQVYNSDTLARAELRSRASGPHLRIDPGGDAPRSAPRAEGDERERPPRRSGTSRAWPDDG
jgi:hypothetical protein